MFYFYILLSLSALCEKSHFFLHKCNLQRYFFLFKKTNVWQKSAKKNAAVPSSRVFLPGHGLFFTVALYFVFFEEFLIAAFTEVVHGAEEACHFGGIGYESVAVFAVFP